MKANVVDFCVYQYGTRTRSDLASYFANTSYSYISLPLAIENESFSALPQKTLRMFDDFVNRRSCRALLKIDDDADVCIHRFNIASPLETLYAGVWTKHPSFDYSPHDKYWTYRLADRNAARKAYDIGYMQGSAYIVGGDVVRHMRASHNASSLDSGWEDVNVGLLSRDMPSRVVHKLRQRRMSLCTKRLAVYHRCRTHPACGRFLSAEPESTVEGGWREGRGGR